LAVVLGVFAVAAILLKKAWPGKRLLMGSSMKIISRTAISSKQTLMMVKLGSRILVLGVTPDQINTLCVVEDPHQVALMLGEAVSDQPSSMTQAFAQAFRDESHAYEGRREQHAEADTYEPQARSNRETVSNRPAESDEQLRGLLEKVRKMNREKSVA
jgi:flagellar biosynthetic protein FliO